MTKEWECARCGKKLDMSKGAYGLSLSENQPTERVELILWFSSRYCSQGCLKKSLNRIRSELIAWLQERIGQVTYLKN